MSQTKDVPYDVEHVMWMYKGVMKHFGLDLNHVVVVMCGVGANITHTRMMLSQ